MSRPEPVAPDTAASRRWLAIVGIGEDGVDGLSAAARRLVADAEIVFGGQRHLALAKSIIRGAVRPWPSPFDRAVEEVLANRGRQVCVLASGDPFHYGVGPLLAQAIPVDDMIALPAPSAFSLAAARLGWSLADTTLLSLHGRPMELLRPHLHQAAHILALTSDGAAPGKIAALLTELGFGRSRVTVLEALGGPNERTSTSNAANFGAKEFNPLNLLALETESAPEARPIPRAAGLPDDWFEHDGQITKRDTRAITLSALAPEPGDLLWDVGAGAGSVSIEWLLADRSMRAIAIEAAPARVARIAHNASSLGVPHLAIVEARAPAAFDGLATPDAIFVGCGAGDGTIFPAAIAALRSGGRLVANAVTLETEAALLALHRGHGGELLRIAVSHAEPVGGLTGWRPAMPVTQWRWVKP